MKNVGIQRLLIFHYSQLYYCEEFHNPFMLFRQALRYCYSVYAVKLRYILLRIRICYSPILKFLYTSQQSLSLHFYLFDYEFLSIQVHYFLVVFFLHKFFIIPFPHFSTFLISFDWMLKFYLYTLSLLRIISLFRFLICLSHWKLNFSLFYFLSLFYVDYFCSLIFRRIFTFFSSPTQQQLTTKQKTKFIVTQRNKKEMFIYTL